MNIDYKSLFDIALVFIKQDSELDTESWLVSDLLSSIDLMPSFKNNISSPTADPAYWFDWKELVEEAVANDKSILDEKNGLTLEQGLVAMQYFMEQRYWVKDKDMLLKDAYDDLVNEYNIHKDNFESSQLGQEWLAAVNEGKKFDKVFKEKG